MNRPQYGAILFFLQRYKMMYAVILGLALPVALLEGLSVAAFFPLFSTMLGDSPEHVGGFAGVAIRVAEGLPISSEFGAAAVLLGVIFVIKTAGILGRDLLVGYVGAKIHFDVKQQIMERYSGAEYQFILDNQQGSLVYGSRQAPGSVIVLHLAFSYVITSLMKMVTIGIVLISLLPYPALAFIVLGLGYYLVMHYISNKVTFSLAQRKMVTNQVQDIVANEFLNGFRQITSFNIGKKWMEKFEEANRTDCEIYAKDLAWRAVPRPLLEMVALALLLGFVLFLRASNPVTFAEQLPGLGLFAVALVQILPSISSFGISRMQLMSALPNVHLARLSLTSSIPARREGSYVLTSFDKSIDFEDVSFTHRGRDTLLDRVNMSFKKGEITAIVGPSGSGKTTLINMILGLFQPTGGRITVDGTPLQDLTNESWLRRLGFVSQDPFLYHTTIEENIRFYRTGHSEEELNRAATIANVHDFICELPEAYDTLAGDRGIKLSGGQQQRICIARAVLDAPEILIFDEATSSLDSIGEKQVQQAVDNASADRTVIIIAHRLSTIRQANKIIVLDNGKIVEQGTHDELLKSQGHYYQQVAASV